MFALVPSTSLTGSTTSNPYSMRRYWPPEVPAQVYNKHCPRHSLTDEDIKYRVQRHREGREERRDRRRQRRRDRDGRRPRRSRARSRSHSGSPRRRRDRGDEQVFSKIEHWLN